ncbi:MAG: hypothetical protein PVI01_19045 [Gemmatimonadales bacterium]|jgi:hypothetical protein
MRRRINSWGLFALALLAVPPPLTAQIEPGSLVGKQELVSTLPADSEYPEPRELVRAETGRLSTMTARFHEGGKHGGIVEHREVFLAMHARPGFTGTAYDRGIAAVREDSLFRVVYVAEIDPGLGFVTRLETLVPPGSPFDARLLHVRYAQTGSGGVTEDLLFALDADGQLVEVPIVQPDLQQLLEEGEYLCCGRFTEFDDDMIEFTVYVTRSGRHGITHSVRSRFSLQGGFEFDAGRQQYVPRFRLVTLETSDREPR